MSELELMILDALDKWLEKDVRPVASELEKKDEYPHQLVEEMKDLGLFGATIGEKWGGLGLPASTYSKIVSQISEVWMSLTGVINSHLMMARCIEQYGTEDQKAIWLPLLATGELRGGLALTEPGAGTDLQGMRTTAKKTKDGYVINGTKTWITNALYGDCTALLVRTDPEADPPRKGMSMFIADKTDGFTVSRKLEKLGYKGIDTAEIVFEDYHRSDSHLIGGVEGQGFYQAVGGLELGRINVAARGVGIAKAALDVAIRYAQERKTFGKPICKHQAIQTMLGDMGTRTEAARLLVESAAAAYDAGRRCDMEAGMAKLYASEAALQNSIEAMRILGAYGYSPEYVVERLYRDAPLLAIGEGTNEMQRIIISRQLVERNKI